MKKLHFLQFALLLFLGTTSFCAYAQSEEDSTINDLPYAILADSIYGNLHPDSIPFGILIEKAFPTIDVQDYNGLATNVKTLNHDGWLRVYGTLRRAFVNEANAYDSLGPVADTIQAYINRGLMPVTLFNYQYSTIRADAVTENLLTIGEDGWQVFDVLGRTQSPYLTKTCFAVAPGALTSETHNVTFVFPQQLYFTNDARIVDHLEVDFGDGNGYVVVHFEDEITIDYDESDIAIRLDLKLVYSDLTILTAQSNFAIVNEYRVTTGEFWLNIEAEQPYPENTAEKGIARVVITTGCGNGGKLMKPFILVEGIDDLEKVERTMDLPKNGLGELGVFAQINKHNPTLVQHLISLGYDLVSVDFLNNSGSPIQQSAYALEAVIKYVNDQKRANNSTHKNVILGISMGGLITHYALSHMTKNNVDHDTKLFVSFDSPHRGANVPLGLQAMIKESYDLFIKNKVTIPEMGRLYWDNRMLNSEAGKQMLISSYNCLDCPTKHNTLIAELDALDLNTKTGCRSIAISNGAWLGTGSRQHNISNPNTLLSPNGMLYKALTSNYLFRVNACPDITQGSSVIYKGTFTKVITMLGKIITSQPKTISYATDPLKNGLDALDFVQGSAINSLSARMPSLGIVRGQDFSSSCFIPTYSALNMSGVNPDTNLTTASSTFDRLVISSRQSPPFNESHVEYTPSNTSVFWELVNIIPVSLSPPSNFNFGLNTDDRLGSITVNGGSVLSINKNVPTGLTPSANSGLNPNNNTLFNVHTFTIAPCTPDSVVITIENGGILELGDAASNRSGELHLRSGSRLILKDGASLKLYNASRLVVDQGATLEIWPTASLHLDDATCVMNINGKLKLLNNTTFKLSTTSNGYVQFGLPGNTSLISVETGTSCKIELIGNSRYGRKLLEINGVLKPELNTLVLLRIQGGTVEQGNGAYISTTSPVHLEDVAFLKLPTSNNTFVHNGISLSGQDENDIYIRHCDFMNANTAITRVGSTSLSPSMEIGDCLFNQCNIGIYTTDKGIRLKYVKFTNCNTGWYAENMAGASEFLGITQNSSKGIDYTGTGNLFIYHSSFSNTANTAVKVNGSGTCAVKCSDFITNANDIEKSDGILNLSTSVAYTRISNNLDYPGKNTFNNTNAACITSGNLDNLYLRNGQNSFVFNSNNPNYVVFGNISATSSQTQLDITNNYWQMQAGGTVNYPILPSSYFTIGKGSTLLNVFTNSNLSTSAIDCGRWNGERVTDNDWGMYAKRSLTNALPSYATDTKTSELLLYPNPVESRLSIQVIKGEINGEAYQIKLIDQLGKQVVLQQLTATDAKETLAFDLSNLSAGLYQVMVEINGVTVHQQKLLKCK